MIVIDTSALIDSFCDDCGSAPKFRALIASGEQIVLSTIVLYEWLRGPRYSQELRLQEEMLPREQSVAFGAPEAAIAAELYRKVRAARGREMDLAIASITIARGAALWTLNRQDFEDIPGLQLI